MSAPVSTRVAEKVSGLLSSRFSRRGFFARSAVVGSAVAVSPVGFALRPTTAYAAVCNCQGSACECGSLCCDGYTEFCCTLTGNNKCPPGTLMGGWWKADGSGMCSGARYYMDCNAPCNGCGCGSNGVCGGGCSGTGCGCANGDCNNRKAGCTQFRYGQCNQSIPCIGPILCRVVTCLAPWDIDPSCTTALRVDQATLSHDRPCLHRTIGNLDSVVEENGKYRVKGWALDYDTQGPIRVDLYVDGTIVGSVTANTRRDDVGAANPGHGPFHGFDLVVPGKPGTHDVCAYGINAAGPGDNALLGCRRVVLSNPFGNLDSITAGLGKMKITGWAVDPDTTGPIKVHVYANGTFRGEFTANAFRPDVGAAYPGFGNNHGYTAEFNIEQGTQNVCVYAINVGSGNNNPVLNCQTFVVGTPLGSFEAAATTPGGIRVKGWAIDPDITGPVKVHVYVDGTYQGETVADIPRPDVGAVYPQYGSAHGFEMAFPVAPGSRQVCVYVLNDPPGANPSIGCKTVDVRGIPLGHLETVGVGPGKVTVRGWAIDPDVAAPVKVHVYVDGNYAGEGVADQSRPDVGDLYEGYGDNHGFRFEVPAAAGSRQVCAYALNDKPGLNPQIGCKTVEVLCGLPLGSLDMARVGPGTVHLEGWAIDPDIAGPVKVHVHVDGKYAGEGVADQPRPDVASALPSYGANHGFLLDVPVAAGSRQVCVSALNDKPGVNPQVGCRTVEVGGVPRGSLDIVRAGPGTVRLEGWAVDPDIAGPVKVHVYVDGSYAGEAVADQPRPDVASALPGYGGDHGFTATLSIAAGFHEVTVYTINVAAGNANPAVGRRNVFIGGAPFGSVDQASASAGSITVAGWAIDPDTAEPTEVHVYVDDLMRGVVAAGDARTDVTLAYPLYGPDHGYSQSFAVSPGTHKVCVFGINRAGTGDNPLLACKTVTA